MSNVTRSILLMTAIVMFGFIFAGQSKSQFQTPDNSLQWEYHVTQGLSPITGNHLNPLGQDGWELVTAFERQDRSGVSAVYKRRK